VFQRRALAALAAFALIVMGCQKPAVVTIPIASWAGFQYFHLAHEKQLDQKAGLVIDTLGFSDPPEIVKAFEEGRFPIAQLTTVEAVDICSRQPKRCPVVVLILDESRGGDKVAVRRSLGTIAALRGKRVAVTPSTLGPFVLSRALARHGMSLADVRIVAVPLADMGRRLISGQIDGAAFYPPFSDAVLDGGEAVTAFTSAEIPGEIFDVLVVDPQYYRTNRHILGRLVRVWQQAHDLADRDPEAQDIMARRQGVRAEVFREWEKGLLYLSLSEQRPMLLPGGKLERNLADVLAVQKQLGLIRGRVPLPRVSTEPIDLALK
jgi:NitT/TauT family transport system substrate-binding protein